MLQTVAKRDDLLMLTNRDAGLGAVLHRPDAVPRVVHIDTAFAAGYWEPSADPLPALPTSTIAELAAFNKRFPASAGDVGPKGDAVRAASHPGQRFRHGWVPIGGADLTEDHAVLKDVFDASTEDGTWIQTGKGDPAMVALARAQGFDGHPTTLSDTEFDAAVKAKGHTVLYRGTRPPDDMIEFGQQPSADAATSPAEMHAEFRDGIYRPGFGIFGNGFYMAPSVDKAASFSDGSPGSVGRFALHHDAKLVDYTRLVDEFGELFYSPAWKVSPQESKDVMGDFGRFAMTKGYDAIRVPVGTKLPNGIVVDNEEFVILNRGALLAAATDGRT